MLNEDYVFNAEETHSVVEMNDGRTLAMKWDEEVDFCDVVCGDQGMTMIASIGGGSKLLMCAPLMIFQKNCSYPMQGLPDTFPGMAREVDLNAG